MAGYFGGNNIVMTCNNITFANSGVDGGGQTRASVTLAGKTDLDPANTGQPISYVENGLTFNGLTLKIGDKITLNSNTSTNYPDSLPTFVGYITSIAPTTQDMNSVVNLELRDEKWKWSQISLPSLILNQGQKPLTNKDGRPSTEGTAADKEMTIHEMLAFVADFVRNFHNDFNFDFASLPNRQVGEVTMNGNAYAFILRLITQFYGTMYQFYSPKAGELKIVRVETRRSRLAQFRVDKKNLISNNMVLAAAPDEDIDVLFCVGANRQYYVGDGAFDNELVPDWDWWNDARILIIDKKTFTPALYKDGSGNFQLVNPFDFAINTSDPDNPVFLGPGTAVSDNIIVFREFFETYPTYWEYKQRMNNPKNTETVNVDGFQTAILAVKWAASTTFAFDAMLRANALTEPLHNGRFRRFRLKDYTPRHYVYQTSTGQFAHGYFYDTDIYPNLGKALPGDPMNLNARVLAGLNDVQDPILFDRYKVQDVDAYGGYKVVIMDTFLNNASHEIRLMRQKPGTFLTGVHSPSDMTNNFLPIPDDADITRPKEASSLGPIVIKYDLVAGKRRPGNNTDVFAEKVRANGFTIVSGNRILFNEPQVFISDMINESLIKSLYDAQSDEELNNLHAFYDPKIYDNNGLDTGKEWYKMFAIGNQRAPYPAVRKIKYEVRSRDVVTKDGTKQETELYQLADSSYPLAIPRIELYGFVQYVDFPEREKHELLANIHESAYWNHVKYLIQYPENISELNKRKVVFEYRDDIVYQTGGYYTYTGDRQEDRDKFEIIAFYDDVNINIAEDFDSGDQNLMGYGQKKTLIAFQLRNDKYKFTRDAELRVGNLVPKGDARYFNRDDIFPEDNGQNMFISSVTHNLANGWQVDISYGGSAPTMRRLYEDSIKLNAGIYNVMEDTKNRNMTALLVTPAQKRVTP